jgi:hypothetical protein
LGLFAITQHYDKGMALDLAKLPRGESDGAFGFTPEPRFAGISLFFMGLLLLAIHGLFSLLALIKVWALA